MVEKVVKLNNMIISVKVEVRNFRKKKIPNTDMADYAFDIYVNGRTSAGLQDRVKYNARSKEDVKKYVIDKLRSPFG